MRTSTSVAASVLLLLHPLLGAAISPATCSSYCKKLDSLLDQCSSGTESAFPACFCHPSSVSETTIIEAINTCVVCNQDGLGSHKLVEYQSADVLCRAYDLNGNAAALSILQSPETAVIEYFSTSILPELSAHAGGGGATPTPMPGGTGTMHATKNPIVTHHPAATSSASKSAGGFPGGVLTALPGPSQTPTPTIQATTSSSTAAAAHVGPAQLGLALGLLGFLF